MPIDAPTARSLQRLHLIAGEERGRIYVRVELFDSDANLLGVADSKVFRALSEQELAADPPPCGPPDGLPPPASPG